MTWSPDWKKLSLARVKESVADLVWVRQLDENTAVEGRQQHQACDLFRLVTENVSIATLKVILLRTVHLQKSNIAAGCGANSYRISQITPQCPPPSYQSVY